MSENTVFRREPFKSGNSDVISVTGIPGVSKDGEMLLKRVSVEGVDAMLMMSYDKISKYELEQIQSLSVDSE